MTELIYFFVWFMEEYFIFDQISIIHFSKNYYANNEFHEKIIKN